MKLLKKKIQDSIAKPLTAFIKGSFTVSVDGCACESDVGLIYLGRMSQRTDPIDEFRTNLYRAMDRSVTTTAGLLIDNISDLSRPHQSPKHVTDVWSNRIDITTKLMSAISLADTSKLTVTPWSIPYSPRQSRESKDVLMKELKFLWDNGVEELGSNLRNYFYPKS